MRLFTLVIASLLVVTSPAGCGSSSNGVASKSASEILAASKTTAEAATSVHVTSKTAQGRLNAMTDLQLTGEGGRAHISLLGIAFETIRTGDTLYIKGSPLFNKRLYRTTGLRLPEDAWLKTPAKDSPLAQLAVYTNLNSELGFMLTSTGNPLTKGATTTIDGQQAIELKETAKLYRGTFYIATTGKPYPIQIIKHGRETGLTTFTDWNRPVHVDSPTNAVDVSVLEHKKRG
jgi:hypothetical protein